MSQKDKAILAGLIPWFCFLVFYLVYIVLDTPCPREPRKVGQIIWTGNSIQCMRRYEILSIEGNVFTLKDASNGAIIIKELKEPQ